MGVSHNMDVLEQKRPYLRGVKALMDKGMDVVPDIYIKPEHKRSTNTQNTLEIPVVDLQDLNGDKRHRTIKAIGEACEKWGFFQVTNHGVALSLVDEMQEVAHEFFDLPVEEKMLYHARSMFSTMYGTSFNPYEDETFDWRDYLKHSCNPLSDESTSSWPANPPHYREIAARYSRALAALSEALLTALSESLGLHPECLQKAFGSPDNEQFLLLNYYPPCPDPKLAMGLSSHSDVGGITILFQDDTSGLQVFKDEEWIPVMPIPGAFVVNVGDQLQVLSNGKYKSVEHRVVLNSEYARLSIAYFYHPSFNMVVSPAEELVDESHPPLYKEFTFAEYKKLFYSKLNGKACIQNFQIY